MANDDKKNRAPKSENAGQFDAAPVLPDWMKDADEEEIAAMKAAIEEKRKSRILKVWEGVDLTHPLSTLNTLPTSPGVVLRLNDLPCVQVLLNANGRLSKENEELKRQLEEAKAPRTSTGAARPRTSNEETKAIETAILATFERLGANGVHGQYACDSLRIHVGGEMGKSEAFRLALKHLEAAGKLSATGEKRSKVYRLVVPAPAETKAPETPAN